MLKREELGSHNEKYEPLFSKVGFNYKKALNIKKVIDELNFRKNYKIIKRSKNEL
jgi:hypothetical protein